MYNVYNEKFTIKIIGKNGFACRFELHLKISILFKSESKWENKNNTKQEKMSGVFYTFDKNYGAYVFLGNSTESIACSTVCFTHT